MADWYVFRKDGIPLGPWSTEHIADAILRGELPQDVWVSVPGGSRWVRALDVPNIAIRACGIETRPQRDSGFVVVGKGDYASTVMMVKEDEAEIVPDDTPTERDLAPPPPPSSPTPPTTRPGDGDTLESPARRRGGGSLRRGRHPIGGRRRTNRVRRELRRARGVRLGMKTFAWVTGMLVGAVALAGGVAAAGCGDPGAGSSASAETADEKLAQDIGAQSLGAVAIQPAKLDPTTNTVLPRGPKAWQYLPKNADGSTQGIFTTMLEMSGIEPCGTRPNALSGNPGFFELIEEGNSMVLDSTGSRATFGYWVTPNDGTAFFVLFSYDHVDDPQTKICLCAEEVFVFGPMRFDENKIPIPNPPPLADGLAVNGADGKLLPAVPLTIADAFNYEGGGPYLDGSKSKPKGTAVTPGASANGQGCRLCHGTNVDAMPQVTRQFPWFPVPTSDGGAPDGGVPEAGSDDAGSTSK